MKTYRIYYRRTKDEETSTDEIARNLQSAIARFNYNTRWNFSDKITRVTSNDSEWVAIGIWENKHPERNYAPKTILQKTSKLKPKDESLQQELFQNG